jgi:adenylate kinase family enzyme
MRLMILGNSGSGKSTLAAQVGVTCLVATHDLDHFHWHADGRKRNEAEARALVADVATGPAWIIEGVYGWLAEVALLRATDLVWLDLPWAECQDGLLRRGLRRGMTQHDQTPLLAWAGAYWTRTSSSSFRGHKLLYNAFAGSKWHLKSRAELSAFSVTFDG